MSKKEFKFSEIMIEIATHYLKNGCDECDFLRVSETCDSVPIHCNWMKLYHYFKSDEKERTEIRITKKEMVDMLRGKTFYDCSRENVLEDVQRDFDEIADYIEQSEKVVRCKDCVLGRVKSVAHEEIDCPNMTCYVDFNDFCSMGAKRKDGDQ